MPGPCGPLNINLESCAVVFVAGANADICAILVFAGYVLGNWLTGVKFRGLKNRHGKGLCLFLRAAGEVKIAIKPSLINLDNVGMSRIGKKPIFVPAGVTVTVSANLVSVKGPQGELKREIHSDFRVEVKTVAGEKGGADLTEVIIKPKAVSSKLLALWGLERSLIANMVEGVEKGFIKKLEFEGIGYRASVEGDTLVMQLGFSHPVKLRAPAGIKFTVEKNTITVAGINKETVGQAAAMARALKPPEPYKGKGIRYRGEFIRRKAGKKAVASA